ncbi:3-phosphoshikimate 1-carboxyvinyltransferase [Striga asiatica]|uniref:3-phosphoshikimate 1-carboxyvinyltransferase n=1 Tax=Striga asiatica TaxID=4170 RepID=A0A5A7P910_STRAF|nr:3-phosphoshikimate 1-carboxyvinyltransferase [Striga asiatica]
MISAIKRGKGLIHVYLALEIKRKRRWFDFGLDFLVELGWGLFGAGFSNFGELYVNLCKCGSWSLNITFYIASSLKTGFVGETRWEHKQEADLHAAISPADNNSTRPPSAPPSQAGPQRKSTAPSVPKDDDEPTLLAAADTNLPASASQYTDDFPFSPGPVLLLFGPLSRPGTSFGPLVPGEFMVGDTYIESALDGLRFTASGLLRLLRLRAHMSALARLGGYELFPVPAFGSGSWGLLGLEPTGRRMEDEARALAPALWASVESSLASFHALIRIGRWAARLPLSGCGASGSTVDGARPGSRELLPLMAVTAELVGEEGKLCWSPASTEGPGASLCVLIATTYSYVVIPYT